MAIVGVKHIFSKTFDSCFNKILISLSILFKCSGCSVVSL